MAIDLRVGTSGYSYDAWKGSFYPAELPATKMLNHYAERLGTVEINNTFYRMPSVTTLEKWRGQVRDDFLFVLKAPQQITHGARLRDVAETVAHFFKVAKTLESRRGPTLFQLPPYMKKDVARLKDFLAGIPEDERVAVEFRHDSWFDDAVYTTLSDKGAALCIADVDEPDASTPRHVTAKWGYVRLRRTAYGEQQLRQFYGWMQAQNWDQAFVFFKHEDSGMGPKLALDLIQLVKDY